MLLDLLFVLSAAITGTGLAVAIINRPVKRIEPLMYQDSLDSFRLIEKSTGEWDTSFVDGLDDE